MRAVWAMIPLLPGCSELDPDYAVSQWYDGVEDNRPTGQGLHPETLTAGEWSRSTARSVEGESSWHFGDGTTWPTLCDSPLSTPDFEAGRVSFLRFAWWSDIPPLSAETATDGAAVEVQVDGEDQWRFLELRSGYPYVLDRSAIGSPLSLEEGLLSGNERTWHDDYVVLDDVEAGQTVRFRFRFGCDVSPGNNAGEGLYVDDVEFLILE